MAGARGSGGGRIRTYRGHLGSLVFLTLLCVVFGGLLVFFGLLFVLGAGAHVAVAIPFCVLGAGLFLLAFCVVRGVTFVDDDGLTLRWLRTRRFAWGDLVAVELEHNAPASAERKRPVMSVVVYTRDGRRVSLPNVIDTRSLSAGREVRVIREVWERRRGADWTPRPEVAEAARAEADASEHTQNALTDSMGWGLAAVRVLVFCVLVVAVLFLATGNADSLPDIPGAILAGVFAAVFLAPLAVALAGRAAARRRRGDGPGAGRESGEPPW
ncbi:PH domain-containing protein [Streptomyces synnematoformans]|uniref:Low molecular weight protein antigen 6 PH domain-containing protein n=1 Tax=Streptomyces synnematoformans TaxID=415721 RepID=A0ABP5K921_9ACTN